MFTAFVYCSLLVTFATCTGICAFIWSGRRSTPHRLLLMTQVFYALWAFLLLAIFVTPDLHHKALLTQARQLFLPLMMPTWLVLVLYIFYRPWWEKKRRYWWLLYVIPVCAITINILSMLDVPLVHQWFFYDFSISPDVPWLMRFKSGWAVKSLFSYIYSCGLVVYGVYFFTILFGKGLKRKYAFFMAFSALLHVCFEVFGRAILHNPEMAQLSIAAVWPMALVLYYVVSRLDFMDLKSLAQQQVFESIPSPVLVVTSEKILWDANEAAHRILGFSKNDFGSNLNNLPHLGDILADRAEASVNSRNYQISKHTLELHSSENQAFIYVLNDVTDIKELNEELSENIQILQELNGRILAATRLNRKIQTVLSHDMSGSLSGLNLLLTSAKNQADSNTASSLAKAAEASQSSLRLLQDVLAWARDEEAASVICVESSVKNALSHLAPQILEKSILITNSFPKEKVYVQGSSKLIETILRNLLSNAIRYSHHSGKVLVSINTDADMMKISITDQGVGMESSQVEYILNRQVHGSSHADGFGLGLGFTVEFVEQLKGRLTVDSKLGEGSTFTVFLPLVSSPYLDRSSSP